MKCFTKSATAFALLLALLLLNTVSFGALAKWDVSADYSTETNPAPPVNGGIWSYGQTPYGNDTGDGPIPDASQFLLYDENAQVINQPGQAWQDLAAGTVDALGAVSFNDTGSFNTNFGIDWEPLEIDLVPDQTSQVVSTARLQVPADGIYSVHAEFADNQSCCAGREGDAWVFTDNAFQPSPLFYNPVLAASDPYLTHGAGTEREFGGSFLDPPEAPGVCGPDHCYDGLVELNAGDSIYFASGKGPSGGDHVVLRATVEQLSGETVAAHTEFSWKNDKSDNWDITSNWSPGVKPGNPVNNPGNVEDQVAIFGDAITQPQVVYTNVDKTLNAIRFDNANSYAIAGNGTITLAAGSDGTIAPTLGATQGAHQFQLNVALNADTTAEITSGATVAFNNRLSLNDNNLTVAGGGQLAVNNNTNTGSGSISVTSGVLLGSGRIGGNLSNDNIVAPGNSTGILSVDGDYTQSASGTLQIELASNGGVAGTDHDRLDVILSANLDGTLDLQLDGGYMPTIGDSFTGLVTAGTISGKFATTNNAVINGRQGIAVTYTETAVNAQIALRGNTDVASGDIDVDTGDLTTAIINFTSAGGSGKTWAEGDMDGDGDVDTGDLTTSIINFTSALAASSQQSVPEPSSGILISIGLLGLLAGARQRKNSFLSR